MTEGIAGDFFSLLESRKVPVTNVERLHASVQTQSHVPVQTQATTVFAFHYKDGVLMAGDRRATAGNIIVTDKVDKVIDIDATSILAIAGVPATAFEMARVMQTSFEYYRRSQLQPLSLPAKVRALARLLRENLPMTLQGVGVVVPLFAGLDTQSTPPKPLIFFYDPLGAQFQAVGHACFRFRFREHSQHSQLPGEIRESAPVPDESTTSGSIHTPPADDCL
jgi:proteasome beta subunit